jgi:hypothetical protein
MNATCYSMRLARRKSRRRLRAACAAGIGAAIVMAGASAGVAETTCSVFAKPPCTPSFCSVFRRGPCQPEIDYPIGQDLRLTVSSRALDDAAGSKPEGELDTIREIFAALRRCWIPPDLDKASEGMQVSVRLSFRRDGEVIGTPRWTYATPDASAETRDAYRDSVTAAIARCTPLPFTKGLGGAIAGRPIAIRFIEDRSPVGPQAKELK